MKSISVFSILIFLINCVLAQSGLKNSILKNTNKIESIFINDSQDFDLNILGKAIGNSRVVMIGEQDHGDAMTFSAKARIIKYLHDSLAFNVLAFESDFFSLNQDWKNVENGTISITNYLKRNIYPTWTMCYECSDAFTYIQSTYNKKNKLIITGFDNQMLGDYSQSHFKIDIANFLDSTNIRFIDKDVYKNIFLPYIDSILYFITQTTINNFEKIHIKKIDSLANIILSELKNQNLESKFEYMVFANFESDCRCLLLMSQKKYIDAILLRDIQMSQNLIWILKYKYPEQKIIVWAANSHIMKNSIDSSYPYSMAYFINNTSEFSDKIYSLGFTDYLVSAGRIYSKPYNIISPQSESLEAWVNEMGYDYAFINFKNLEAWKNSSFVMRGQDHYQTSAKWMKIFDGIFYIKEMRPCSINKEN